MWRLCLRIPQSHSLVPPHQVSARGTRGGSCLLSTCLVRESASVCFRELQNGLPITETQKNWCLIHPWERLSKLWTKAWLQPTIQSGEGGGNHFDSRDRRAWPRGGICSPLLTTASGRWGPYVSCGPEMGRLVQQATREFLTVARDRKAPVQAQKVLQERKEPPKFPQNAYNTASGNPLQGQKAEATSQVRSALLLIPSCSHSIHFPCPQ